MIPQEKSAAVTRALREAFGVAALDDICWMTRGLSSDLVFQIVVRGAPYLLRIMMRIDERNDPARQFTSMKMAADAGLAPRVWYANTEDGVSIIDFVEARDLAVEEARVRIAGALRRLHALPLFPKTFNYVTAHKGFIWRLRGAGILAKSEIEEGFRRYLEVCAVYPRLDADMVSCHNDLKPENILFDGERVWLVDWQAAFVNDRYFDLAVAANFVVADEAEERVYLQEYFGRPPDEYQLARFFLMRQVLHMLAAAVFLLLSAPGTVDESANLPSFGEFHQRIWAGRVNLADNDMRIVYGRIHWERLLQNSRQTRFEEALRTVAKRHGDEKDGRRLLPSTEERGARTS